MGRCKIQDASPCGLGIRHPVQLVVRQSSNHQQRPQLKLNVFRFDSTGVFNRAGVFALLDSTICRKKSGLKKRRVQVECRRRRCFRRSQITGCQGLPGLNQKTICPGQRLVVEMPAAPGNSDDSGKDNPHCPPPYILTPERHGEILTAVSIPGCRIG